MKKNSKKTPKTRNPIAIMCFERFGRTTKIYHDRRQERDRNRGQTQKRAIEES
jgi:hypothetical protein